MLQAVIVQEDGNLVDQIGATHSSRVYDPAEHGNVQGTRSSRIGHNLHDDTALLQWLVYQFSH